MTTQKTSITGLFLYRARYVFGYTALALLFVGGLLAAALYAPGGLTQAEIDNIRTTNQVSLAEPATLAQPNVLLHGLQRVSFAVFGVSQLSIKLPAMLLSIVAALAIFFLLRRWFRPNVAILSLLIMTATGQFLYVGQNFSPHILYITFSALILLFASLVLQRAKGDQLWKFGLAITTALSLYTPYFWYINLGLLLVALLHPHTRHFLLSRKYRASWLPASISFTILITPLVYACMVRPEFLQQLLGLSSLDLSLLDNLKTLGRTYFWPTPTVIGGQLTPIIDIGALALIVMGFFVTLTLRYAARAYMIGAWLVLALPLLLVQPYLSIIITVPLFILLAVGVETLIRRWYRLFPKNPYARATGLVVMVGLVGVMVLGGLDRYIQGYRHTPEVVHEHSTDSRTISAILPSLGDVKLLVIPAEEPLYQALANYRTGGRLHINQSATAATPHYCIISRARRQATTQPACQGRLWRIITNDRSVEADRFYIYKKSAE